MNNRIKRKGRVNTLPLLENDREIRQPVYGYQPSLDHNVPTKRKQFGLQVSEPQPYRGQSLLKSEFNSPKFEIKQEKPKVTSTMAMAKQPSFSQQHIETRRKVQDYRNEQFDQSLAGRTYNTIGAGVLGVSKIVPDFIKVTQQMDANSAKEQLVKLDRLDVLNAKLKSEGKLLPVEMVERGRLMDRFATTSRESVEKRASGAFLKDKVATAVRSASDHLTTKQEEAVARAKAGLSPAGQFAVDLGVSGTDLATKGIVSAATGIPFLAMSAVGSGTQAASQALDEGRTVNEVAAMGVGAGAITAGIESLSGIGGDNAAKLYQKFAATEIGKKLVGQFTGKTFSALGKVMQNPIVQDALGEAGEEFTEYYAQALYESIIKDKSIETDVREALLSALAGGIIGGIFGGGKALLGGGRNGDNVVSDTHDTQVTQDVQRENSVLDAHETQEVQVTQGFDKAEKPVLDPSPNLISDVPNVVEVERTHNAPNTHETQDTQAVQEYYEDILPPEIAEEFWSKQDKEIQDYLSDYTEPEGFKEFASMGEGNQKAVTRQSFNENVLIKSLVNSINHIDNVVNIKVSGKELRQDLKQQARAISKELMQTGRVSNKAKTSFLNTAIDGARVQLTDAYNRSIPVRQSLKNTPIFVSENLKRDFPDWNEFARHNFGRMRLTSDPRAMGVDVLYSELALANPGELDALVDVDADQLRALSDYLDRSAKVESDLRSFQDENYGEAGLSDITRNFEAAFDSYVADSKRVARYAKDIYDQKEAKRIENENALREISPAEVERLTKEREGLRRDLEKYLRIATMTKEDRGTVDALLKGAVKLEEVQDRYNIRDIQKVYELRKQINDITAQVKPFKSAVYELNKAKVESTMDGIDLKNWRNEKMGLKMELIPPEKMFAFISQDKQVGDKLTKEFISPIIHADGEATRAYNQFYNPVADYAKEHKITKEEDALANHYNLYRQEFESSPDGSLGQLEYLEKMREVERQLGERFEVVKGLSDMIWNSFPELIQMQNKALVRNGFDAKQERKTYYPITYDRSSDSVLNKLTDLLGGKPTADLPTDRAGKTGDYKPNKTWNKFLLERSAEGIGDFDTEIGATEVYSGYLSMAMDTAYKAEGIRRLRTLSDYIRTNLSDKGLQSQIDEIRNDPNLNPDEADEKIREIRGLDAGHLGQFATWLDNYTNIQANKNNIVDRGVEYLLGRGVYALSNTAQGRVAANMVAGSVSSMASQGLVLAPATAELGPITMQKALFETIKSRLDGGEESKALFQNSDFLTSREGKTAVPQYGLNKYVQKASQPFNDIDTVVAEAITRGYMMKEGLDLETASRKAASMMADRSKGALPMIFHSKNPFFKAMTMFEVENLNQFFHFYGVTKNKFTEDGLKEAAKYVFAYMVASYLMNEPYEKLVGYRPLPDPIHVALQVKDGVQDKGILSAMGDAATDVVGDVPFIGKVVGGGRMPFQAAVPDVGKVYNSVASMSQGKMSGKKVLDNVVTELSRPLTYLALPGGGNQIRKTMDGIRQTANGGEYYINNQGEKQLKYPNGNPLQLAVFGKSSTKEANEYYDKGYKPLSSNDTFAVDHAQTIGMDRKVAYDVVRALEGAENTEDKRRMLFGLEGLTPQQKKWLDQQLFQRKSDGSYTKRFIDYKDQDSFEVSLLGEDERKAYGSLSKAGVSAKAYMTIREKTKGMNGTIDQYGEVIDNSKFYKVKELIDNYSGGVSSEGKLQLYREFNIISDAKAEKAMTYQKQGLPLDVYLEIYSQSKGITSTKNGRGETIPNSKGKKMKRMIDRLLPGDTPRLQRLQVYNEFGVGKSLY